MRCDSKEEVSHHGVTDTLVGPSRMPACLSAPPPTAAEFADPCDTVHVNGVDPHAPRHASRLFRPRVPRAGGNRHAHSQEPARPTAGPPKLSFAEPGISPDGDEIAFVTAATSGSFRRAAARRDSSLRIRQTNLAPSTRRTATGSRSCRTAPGARTSGSSRSPTARSAASRSTTAPSSSTAGRATGEWIYFSTGAHDIAGMRTCIVCKQRRRNANARRRRPVRKRVHGRAGA